MGSTKDYNIPAVDAFLRRFPKFTIAIMSSSIPALLYCA